MGPPVQDSKPSHVPLPLLNAGRGDDEMVRNGEDLAMTMIESGLSLASRP